ncbi:Phospholipid/glycerol acyltransferase [Dillenia turbinata]|uniref:Phospholipid/glycerol acyltransferase n=1 Tax=Dillenia turbinata TaxID=194707 RepID=A0AAN8W519_9MAGN
MEASKPLIEKNRPGPQCLTPLRMVRGVLCLAILLSTAFMTLIYGGFITAVVLRFFSIHYSRRGTSFIFGSWLALWPFMFEKINRTKVIFSGDSVPAGERVLLIANHRTEVDWMYLWNLGLRKGRQGYIKYILKSSLMKLPIFGWAFHLLEFVFVERKWDVDQTHLHQMLSTFKDPQDPLWLALFPEGTDYNEQKCLRSQNYADENGLPILKHVLLPKTKGYCACLEELSGSLDAVYDVTIGYKYHCPSLLDNAFGVEPSEVHIHLKDQLLSDFYLQGNFPNEGTEGSLSISKCLANLTGVIAFTVPTRPYSHGSLDVAGYFASVTFFSIRQVPILSHLKLMIRAKEQKECSLVVGVLDDPRQNHSSCPSNIVTAPISLPFPSLQHAY